MATEVSRRESHAHMRPGTVQVKAGDEVALGQVIRRVGNTGSSEEPHLHMHIDARPSLLGGNGVPTPLRVARRAGRSLQMSHHRPRSTSVRSAARCRQ